ncbi:hypothetical protein F4561_002933 [Lipingzhangella halophila]|uniref:Subtilisin inhibitor domain-containing protein n=1 Tax=Lipingzhangella halophila TaxID=1783352 RepID=A0A7W7W349_9ACTN|nr:SSI family serine proteinase inhibitor [Lipingzhangella halophila]MBB4932113.1 hypothetical protein [Lipingzhangella halophila]
MRKAAIALTALATGALGPATGAPSALASDAPNSARVHLSVTGNGEGAEPSATYLVCFPSGGTHPRAEEACATLDEAGGKFADLPAREGVCTLVYRPVTATAKGHWRGEPVNYEQTFGNSCLAADQTNGVFDF